MDGFEVGKAYTRQQIHNSLGGGMQEYLPHLDGQVLCACLTETMNPGIPDTILVGEGVNVVRYARMFAGQRNYIPVFIKHCSNEWVYVGDYRVRSVSEDKQEISKLAREAMRNDVVMILRLERQG